MTARLRACAASEVAEGAAVAVTVGGHEIAVVRCDDTLYAVGDTCTHQRISLSEGDVLCGERRIECWKHGSAFSLETGEPSSLPATKAVPVFPVSVDGDDVYVEVPS